MITTPAIIKLIRVDAIKKRKAIIDNTHIVPEYTTTGIIGVSILKGLKPMYFLHTNNDVRVLVNENTTSPQAIPSNPK